MDLYASLLHARQAKQEDLVADLESKLASLKTREEVEVLPDIPTAVPPPSPYGDPDAQ